MERAGAIGWSVDQFMAATLPEFIFFFRGWQRSQGIDPDAPSAASGGYMSHEEATQLFQEYEQKSKKP